MTILSALRYRSFAFLFFGQTVSRLGDYVYNVALAWWVLQATGSAAAMGTVLVLSSLPRIFFLLIGGVIVDRVPRAFVILAADGLRGLVVAIVAMLALGGWLQVWMIFAASFLFGSLSSFFEPAYVAIVPDLVPLEGRPSANSLMTLSQRAAGILGPTVGASLVALGGTSLAFGLDAASFFFSALMVLPILRVASLSLRETKRPNVIVDLREGWQFVRTTPWLWISVLIYAVVNPLQFGPYVTLMPVLVKTVLQAPVEVLGLISSATALGATLTAIWLGRYKRLRHRGPGFYGSTLLYGLCIAGMGLFLTIPTEILFAFVFGIFFTIAGLNWNNLLQDKVPGTILGRVASLDALISVALTPIGFGLAGWAADGVGAPLVLTVGGLVSAVVVAIGFLSPAIRELD